MAVNTLKQATESPRPPAPASKLQMPRPDAQWQPRPALIEQLNAGLHRKLTLISAPLGFGKTTLAAHWLSQIDMPVIWVTLDKSDNTLQEYVRLIVRALNQLIPGVFDDALAMLENASAGFLSQLLEKPNELMSVFEQPIMLAVDNCEVLTDPALHTLLREVLFNAPANYHFTVITRVDPPWNLAKLRMMNEVNDLRVASLQFSLEEAAQFVNQGSKSPLDDETLKWLVDYTEGWPAALKMARLAMNHQPPEALLTSFRGTTGQITEYFAEELFNSLPEATQNFLLAASVPDQFCTQLVRAILDDRIFADDAQVILVALENDGLFIRPVDTERVWFRMHPIFRDFLMHALRRHKYVDAWRRSHQNASLWFEQHGMPEPAVRHALIAGDVDRAGSIVLANIRPIQGSTSSATINRNERLLAIFPEADRRERLELLCMQMNIAMRRGNDAEVVRLIKDIESRLASLGDAVDPALRDVAVGIVRGFQGEMAFWHGEGEQALVALN